MSREKFEKWFPLKHLFDYVYFSEDQGNYVYRNYDEKHIEAYEYVNSAWSAWQEQQKRIDAIKQLGYQSRGDIHYLVDEFISKIEEILE